MKKVLYYPLLLIIGFSITAKAQWQVITPSVVPENHLIYTMSAPTKDIVWATTVDWATLDNLIPKQTIIRTTNSGASWTTSTYTSDTTENPLSCFAFDANTCFVSSVNADYVSYLYRTQDGGSTWKKLDIEHPGGFINSVYFWDRMNGIVTGDPVFDDEGNGEYFIYTTRDGGSTWVKSKNTPKTIGGFSEYAFIDGYGTLGANTIFFSSNSPFNRIFKSDDRGLTWREIKNLLNNDTLHIGSSFTGIAFSDSHNGLIAQNYNENAGAEGGEAPVLRTTDGGETWVALEGTNSATRTEKGVIKDVPGADSVYVIGHFNQGSSYTTNFGNSYTFNDFGGNNAEFFSPTEGWMSQFKLGGTHGRIGKFTGNLSPSTIRNVTFQVDMNGQTVSPNGVYLTGDYWSWKPDAVKMTHLGNNIYEAKVKLPRGTALQYKFINGGNWGQHEQVPEGCGSANNRTLTVGQWDLNLPKVTFSSCLESKGNDKPANSSNWCSSAAVACDYFENYKVKAKIALENDAWKTASSYKKVGTKSGADDAEVVSYWNGYTNYSGGRALRIHEGTDITWLLGNKPAGNWDITMRLYVPVNHEAHIAVLSDEKDINSRLFDYVFHTNKTVWADANYKTYPQNEWIAVKINVNLNAHTWSVMVNGATVYSAINADLKQLGALEFFGSSSFTDFYIDELEVKRATINLPTAAASTLSFSVFPNPTKKDFTIEYNYSQMTDISMNLTDITGKVLWSKSIENARQGSEIICNLPLISGVYFVKVKPKGGVEQMQRVVVTN